MITTPVRVTTSPTMATTPLVNSSLMASTSFSTRVMSRPTGLRSKKAESWRWRWANSACRRSCITRCPVSWVTYACTARSA